MSSHHFVKQGQEPALFIVDPVSLELVQPLLEWAPLVIVLDSAIDEVMHWGIKIDVVLAERNELEKIKEKVLEQFPVKIISYKMDDDAIATGLYFLIKSKQTAVNVVIESNKGSAFSFIPDPPAKLTVTLLSRHIKWSFISGREYKKWFPAQMRIKIHACDHQPLSVQGMISHDSEWYRVERDGQVMIKSDGNFWIGEDLETN